MSIYIEEGVIIVPSKKNEKLKGKFSYLYDEKVGMLKFIVDEVVSISIDSILNYELASVSLLKTKKDNYLFKLKKYFFKNISLKKKICIKFDEPYYSKDFFSTFYPIDKINLDFLSFSQIEAKNKFFGNIHNQETITNIINNLNIKKYI